jgi:ATP-dependent Clp protease ATP-binding subunit ClpA
MEFIRSYPNVVLDADGRVFACASYGRQRGDGRCEGRVVFFPLHGGDPLATGRETTQPRRAALEYWADGLTPTFLQGALSRALRRGPDATLDLAPPPPAHGEAVTNDDAARTEDSRHGRPPRGLTGSGGDGPARAARPGRRGGRREDAGESDRGLGGLLSISIGLNAQPLRHGSRARPGAGEDEPLDGMLALYATDLTERARRGEIDPLIGRDAELDRMIHVLCRRRKNNPVLVGDPGAGKTAIVEGLALAIARRRVPAPLRKARVYALDLGGLLAGTQLRGEFEERLTGVVSQIQEDPDAILFIDEIHSIVGAGAGSDSMLDASNLLKPALSAGLRCIGSTTFPEYQASLEHDRALARRFQKIDVREPSIDETVQILMGVSRRYETHHRVRFTPGALRAAAELSVRYLRDRQLPDKAIDLIDEAGAARRLSAGRAKPPVVDVPEIEAVVAKMAGVPTRTISVPDQERLRGLEPALKQVIFGQDTAVEALVRAIKLSRAGVRPPDRPIGSFLFAGPTGVGKTELARQLARQMEVEFLRFDMSEYMEKHTVGQLTGAPPGYIGFEQGGLLTDAVRRNPYAVLLLDEIEKAHPDVFNILLQVMDHATLSDNHGRRADFRQVVLILTTNAGARELFQPVVGFSQDRAPSTQARSEGAIARTFSPEFRNRLDAWIAFEPLTPAVLAKVVDRQVSELAEQLAQKQIRLSLSSEARAWLAGNGFDPKFGARPMARLIERQIAAPVADWILFGPLQSGGAVRVEVQGGSLQVAVATEATP